MSVRDLLALLLGSLQGIVWAVYMISLIRAGRTPAELDWAILPTATGAILGAIYAMTGTSYRARHRGRERP